MKGVGQADLSWPHATDHAWAAGGDKINPPSLVDMTVAALRELILSGAYRPGERLVEERLTERLGISRPPLREALRILQQEGLVVTLPRRGAAVTPLSARDVHEIYTLRFALDRLAVELGVPVRDPALLEPLREALRGIHRAAIQGDRDRLLEENIAFHTAMCGLARHGRLMQAYRSLAFQLRLCMAMNLRLRERMYGNLEENVARHRVLLELAERGDRQGLLIAIADHGDRSFIEHLGELIGPG
ncbi:MAG TPA: GntR family transcriptional regulator [Candidatus Dormibacteraeota bacterium]|nr:GntR family transcriptional regulator [Candidatus Dormibacteraeota bacterium]